jgi:hypothetical protein
LKFKKLWCFGYSWILWQITVNFILRCPHTTLNTLATLNFDDLPHPINSCIIYSFCNIESEIKTTVVRSSENDYKFILLMLYFRYSEFRVLSF